METLVASYTLRLNEGITKPLIDKELQETLELVKGMQRWNTLELPDGSIAFEVHIHGQTAHDVAKRLGDQIYKIITRFDMADVEYHGVEFPDEVKLTPEKWQGRDAINEVVIDQNGERYIRLDYYLRGLSFADLGIHDNNTEMIIVGALQQWPKKVEAREAIRRVRDHFARLRELDLLEQERVRKPEKQRRSAPPKPAEPVAS